MKRHWDEQELAERWSLTHDEFELLRNRTERSRLGFAVLFKFFQVEDVLRELAGEEDLKVPKKQPKCGRLWPNAASAVRPG